MLEVELKLRITAEDRELINALAKRLDGFTPSMVARQALRAGLAEFDRDLTRIVAPSNKGKRLRSS